MITAPKIHTDLLWDLSILFVVLTVAYFVFIFFYRNRLSARGKREKQRKRELSPMISEFLFHEEDASKDEKSNYVNLKIEIRQLLKDDFNRRILSEVLLDLRKDVAGDTQKRLFKLYQDLGLHNDDFKKLKSWRWEIVSKGILDLTQMQVPEAYSFVTKFINDKRHTIRKQAEIAVVTLKPEGINYFLDTTKYKISEWQQLKLMDVLRNEEDYQPPRFKAWLTSTNRHVVLFALRLIKFYNQNDSDAALIELVRHKNNQIKEEVIGCIKEFNIIGALPTLKLVFWKSSTDVKISILNVIGALGNEADIEFLQLIENKEANFSVRSKAHSSINAISPDSIMPSKGLVNTSNYKIPDDIELKEEEEEIELEVEEIKTEHHSPNTIPNETPDQSEEIIDNAIKTDVMEESHEPEQQENTKPIVNENEFSESDILSFDFLPLVIQEAQETKDHDTDKEDFGIELNEIIVSFEEVTAEKEVQPLVKNTPSVEIKEEELAFLPIVTEVIEEISVENTIEDPSSHTISIHEIEVKFEEILNTSQNQELKDPLDYSEYNTPEILNRKVFYEDMEPQDERKFKNTIQDIIDFNNSEQSEKETKQFQNGPLLEFGDEFVETSKVSETEKEIQDELETESFVETEETVQDKPTVTRLTIPNAIHSDNILDEFIMQTKNTEESRMQLLDDIAEMGDWREIPLLNELLVNEKYKTVKGRVKRLIDQFTETEEKPKNSTLLRPFNVFEDLFRTCDTEAKLILMDEILAVGDEAEIVFLESLLEDVEKEICNKAARILEELKAKLSISEETKASKFPSINTDKTALAKIDVLIEDETLAEYDSLMEELQIAPPQTSEIFEVAFELTEPLSLNTENEQPEKIGNQKSFLSQLCEFSNKIMDKFNG